MPLKGKGKFTTPQRSRSVLYISTRLADDSAFPFQPGQELSVRISGKRLIIEAYREPPARPSGARRERSAKKGRKPR